VSTNNRTVLTEYDFIIVGAGSAGCALAGRLSADPQTRVLLLEAGGSDNHWLLRMPLGFLRALLNPEYTWGYMSEPELTLNNRVLWLPRGKLLGGSSSINGMFYMRGHSLDFDGWAANGCAGWSYADVLPYFKRLENSWRGAGKWHGGDGPVRVSPINSRKLLHEPLLASAVAAGYTAVDDLHAERQDGCARGEITVDHRGRRASASRAYLRSARLRPNLTVLTGAHATRVLIESQRAVGIEYRRDGQSRSARAANEVILSGGAFNSPQLLMVSGIGPATQLRAHGIAINADLPGVGTNLSEHARVPIEFALNQPVSFLGELRADRVAISVMRWALFGSGSFATQINSCNIVVRTDKALRQPDIQLMSNPVRMDAKIWWPLLGPKQEHRITADAVVLHPTSRGQVTLRSADPFDQPRVQINALATEADLATARRGVRLAREIYGTAPQAQLIARELAPGTALQTDDQLNAYIRATAGTTQHPVGTCRMGTDPDAVVDAQLRVHGIAGLRVIDASIMPTVPGGNTNAACIMIGEYGADLVRGRKLAPEYRRGEAPQSGNAV
jgi:choline dehydrogenase